MKKTLILISVTILLWCGGAAYYLYYIESYQTNDRSQTDAIVLYTGGSQRINIGVNLLKARYAPLLFIAGVESPQQLKNFFSEHNVRQEQVIYATHNDIKKDSAHEIVEFILMYNLVSIRLVAASYSMPRVLAEIRELLPKNITIIPHPSFSNRRQYRLLFSEYNKFLISMIN